MLVTRPSPFISLNAVRSLERALDEALGGACGCSPGSEQATAREVFPALNAWQDESAITLEAEVPGFKNEQIEISFEADELIIRGRRGEAELPEGAGYIRRERRTAGFKRKLRLTIPIDADNIRASLANGVLTITLPKPRSAQPRRIEVTKV